MILRLNEFQSLHREPFENVFKRMQKDYSTFLSKLYMPPFNLKDKLILACNPVLTNNPYQSELYENFCLIWAVVDLLQNDNRFSSVEVESNLQYMILKAILSERSIDRELLIIRKTGRFREWITQKLNASKGIAGVFYKFFLSLMYSDSERKNAIDLQYEYSLCDTYILQSMVSEDRFCNRYYPPKIVDQIASIKALTQLLFIPEIDSGFFSKKNFRVLQSAKESFIFKHDLLQLSDYCKIFLLGFRKQLPLSEYVFMGVDLRKAIKYQVSRARFRHLSTVESFYAIYRLKKRGLRIHFYVDWWENQMIDKIMNLAMATYYPKVKRSGFVNYLIDLEYNYNILPTAWQKNMCFTPNDFWVPSCFFEKRLSAFCDSFQFLTLTYNRFNIIKRAEEYIGEYILVILPILKTESIFILNTIATYLTLNKPGLKVLVKPHPTHRDLTAYKKIFQLLNMRVINEPLDCLYKGARIVVSSTSSACAEALINEIPLIILSDARYIQNPIPQIEDNNMFRKVSDIEELTGVMNDYCDEEFRFDKRIALKLRELLLNEPISMNAEGF